MDAFISRNGTRFRIVTLDGGKAMPDGIQSVGPVELQPRMAGVMPA